MQVLTDNLEPAQPSDGICAIIETPWGGGGGWLYGGFPNSGVPINSIWVSILGSPYFGKLPYRGLNTGLGWGL